MPAKNYTDILDKFKVALTDFAKSYNEENPENKLRQINVGLGMNDLEEFLTDGNFKISTLLKPFKFGEYGKEFEDHDGDSKNDQVVIWEIDEQREM